MKIPYRIKSHVARLESRARKNEKKLAIDGGTSVRPHYLGWPTWPMISWLDRYNVMRTLEGGNWWYSARVARFESEFAQFQGADFCITCTSGTTGLEVCLESFGIKPGDEVIVPAFTFFATASAVMRFGAVPVFVDVDDSWCIDPDMIERAITSKTRAIIPVHYAGRVADMDRIMKIAHKHDLIVLEDACHAWGSRWNGVGAGVLGHAGVFSFQMSKNLSAGEGGAIVTNDTELATHIRKHTNIGMPPGHRHYHECVGTNARITEFQAALLSAQLTRLDEQTELRMQNAAVLENGIDEIEGLSYPLGDERINRRSYHYFCIEITPEEFGCSRDRFLEAANAEGVTILPPYPEPIYNQPACQGEGIYRKLDCPQTEALCQQTGCWIPHHVLLARLQDMQDILTIFKKIKNSVNRQVV